MITRTMQSVQPALEAPPERHNIEHHHRRAGSKAQRWQIGWEDWLSALKLIQFLDEEDPDCW